MRPCAAGGSGAYWLGWEADAVQLTRFRLCAAGVVGVVLLGAGTALSQRGQGGPGGDRGGGPRGFDPNRIFDFMANGQDTLDAKVWIDRSAQRRPEDGEAIRSWLQKNNIGGTVTRAQFAQYMQEWMAAREAGGGGQRGGQQKGGQSDADRDAEEAKNWFRRMDTKNVGKLTPDDIPSYSALKNEFERWDLNKNGTIELDEYIAYFKARRQYQREQGGDTRGPDGGVDGHVEEPSKRPQIYRIGGTVPKDLPPWFVAMDKDQDGQVALWEWREAGRSVKDFRELDANGDGFITVEEMLRAVAVKKDMSKMESVAAGQGDPSSQGRFDPRQGGQGRFDPRQGGQGGQGRFDPRQGGQGGQGRPDRGQGGQGGQGRPDRGPGGPDRGQTRPDRGNTTPSPNR
jgi:Ca2+-binding EF-hand superfamily protein